MHGGAGAISSCRWFGWVPEGRALQDTWVVPCRVLRTARTRGLANNRQGATIRRFEAHDGQWRLVWINPVSGVQSELAGARTAGRIVLDGAVEGCKACWSFNDIAFAAFVWRGETLADDGTWKTGAEFFLAKRFRDRWPGRPFGYAKPDR